MYAMFWTVALMGGVLFGLGAVAHKIAMLSLF